MRYREQGQGITVLDAIETLSSIIDLDSEIEGASFLTAEELGLEGETVSIKNVEWVRGGDVDVTVKHIRNIFSVILDYVESFYKKGSQYLQNQKTIEGIKNIMFLVGEAAKKLDAYTSSKSESKTRKITKLPEYKKLQDFYREKVDRKIDESILSSWIMGIAKNTILQNVLANWKKRKVVAISRTYVDLDAVKNDHDYELLLIRKSDGSPFYRHQLIRNIKLICDFGLSLSEAERYDILGNVKFWREEALQLSAKQILHAIRDKLKTFYRSSSFNRENQLETLIRNGALALIMAANPENMRKKAPAKTCSQYFSDFQIFLQAAMNSREFQKTIIYQPKGSNILAQNILDIIETICSILFTNLRMMQNFSHRIEQLLHNALRQAENRIGKVGDGTSLWSSLTNDYSAILHSLKYHITGPLERDLEQLDTSEIIGFDTLRQGNLPSYWYDMYWDKNQTKHIRLPCPTVQEQIDQVEISDEFKGFLFDCIRQKERKSLLIFNLQDRLSWREKARCCALENLQKSSLFNDNLTVVTMDTESDFYYQIGLYQKMEDATAFIKEFYEQLTRNDTGYSFPEKLKKQLISYFIQPALESIHTVFFNKKMSLSQDERIDFISLFHFLLQLKIIELTQCSFYSFTCKDGVDASSMTTAIQLLCNHLFNREILSEASREYLNLIIYAPAFLMRERALLPERFNRIVNVAKCVEKTKKNKREAFAEEMKQLIDPLFKTSLIHAHIDMAEAR